MIRYSKCDLNAPHAFQTIIPGMDKYFDMAITATSRMAAGQAPEEKS